MPHCPQSDSSTYLPHELFDPSDPSPLLTIMSRAILDRRGVVPLHLFEPGYLRAENALQDALLHCQSVMHQDNFELVIEDLLTKPNLLQLVISGELGISSSS